LGPQLPFTQACPVEQSALVVQADAQSFCAWLQLYGTQIFKLPGTHRPEPLQTLIPLTAAPSQVPARQTVPAGYCRQAPLPSQVPSCPQVDMADGAQVVALRGLMPSGTNAQVPIMPGTLHALQVSWQADAQQTPSMQNPLSQSPSQAQTVPRVLRGAAAVRQATSEPPSFLPPSAEASSVGPRFWLGGVLLLQLTVAAASTRVATHLPTDNLRVPK
jgi:hypothetical protein